jgi:hypothetical protein
MRKAILAVAVSVLALPLTALTAPASAAPAAAASNVSPSAASCGRAGPELDKRIDADAPSGGAAKQRSGSSTSCAAPGVLQPTDDAEYFCWTIGSDSHTWSYLRNIRTGVRGWVRDDLLDGNGSNRFCGF